MSLAEQKEILHQWISEADAKTTAKLVEFASLFQYNSQPSEEEEAIYIKRSAAFFESGEKGLTKQESLAKLRELLK